jgi:hypothetical protein
MIIELYNIEAFNYLIKMVVKKAHLIKCTSKGFVEKGCFTTYFPLTMFTFLWLEKCSTTGLTYEMMQQINSHVF